MTKRELEQKLRADGWTIIHGSRHDLAVNPNKPGLRIPIPRHRGDIPTGTVNSILRDAGLK